MQDKGRRLLWHGMALFLLGLLTGLFQQELTNPRMGLAAHLEGVMNGIFLLALGSAWSKLRLSPRLGAVAFWTVLCGTYANWAVTLTAAALGTAAMTPIASAGHGTGRWQELLATVGFSTVALLMLVGSVVLLVGFRGRQEAAAPSER